MFWIKLNPRDSASPGVIFAFTAVNTLHEITARVNEGKPTPRFIFGHERITVSGYKILLISNELHWSILSCRVDFCFATFYRL